MLLMVEKGIREGICYYSYRYAKVNQKYMNNHDKHKELSYLQNLDVNNLCGRAMSQKLLVNKFEQIKDTSQFNNYFIKNYNEDSDKGHFLKVNVKYLEKLHELHNDLSFLPERIKIEKVENLVFMIKMNMLTHRKFKTSIKSRISFEKSSQSD